MNTSSTYHGLNYLTVSQAAKILHRKPYPLMEAIGRGELVAYQPSGEGAWLIRPADLRVYVESPESVRRAADRANAISAATQCRFNVLGTMEEAGVDRAKLAEVTGIDPDDLDDSLDDDRPFTVNELAAIADALAVDVLTLVGEVPA